MKRVLAFLLAVCLAVPAAWAAEDGPAEAGSGNPAPEVLAGQLQSLGLFLGNGTGDFVLNRAPTRAEAVVMLVRALGKEEEAKAMPTSHPFADVPAWADGYVSYAYAHGLTKGASETWLNARGDAGAAMYLTFMLRALGYSDQADGQFTWDAPWALAIDCCILPEGVNCAQFTRGDAVTVTAAALFAPLRGAETTLADRLAEEGVFSDEQFSAAFPADPFTDVPQMDEAAALHQDMVADYIFKEEIEFPRILASPLCTVILGIYSTPHGGNHTVELLYPDGTALRLATPRTSYMVHTTISPDEIALSADGKILTYSYLFEERLTSSAQNPDDPEALVFHEAGQYLYTADLTTGKNTLEIVPIPYDIVLERTLQLERFTPVQILESADATILLGTKSYGSGEDDFFLYLVYKPGRTVQEGLRKELPLPATYNYGTGRAPDSLELSADGATLTYVYRFDDQLLVNSAQGPSWGVFHEAGTYTYTVDLASGAVTETISSPVYDEAVAELQNSPGYRSRQTYETDQCTIFVFDRGGFMNAPLGMTELIYKPGSAKGVGTVIILPYPKPGTLWTCTPADTRELSADKSTFTYTYYFDEPFILGPPVVDEPIVCHEAGTYTYTTDLMTGQTTETITPPSYDGAMASLVKNPVYTVELQLEGPSCTAVLRWKDANFAEPVKDYELYLVYQPDSPLADTIRQRLILPSTAAVQGYSNVPTDRVPDTLAFSDDGAALIYTYHFDEALYEYHGDKLYHDAGTYTYTVDLSTGETSVTHTFD